MLMVESEVFVGEDSGEEEDSEIKLMKEINLVNNCHSDKITPMHSSSNALSKVNCIRKVNKVSVAKTNGVLTPESKQDFFERVYISPPPSHPLISGTELYSLKECDNEHQMNQGVVRHHVGDDNSVACVNIISSSNSNSNSALSTSLMSADTVGFHTQKLSLHIECSSNTATERFNESLNSVCTDMTCLEFNSNSTDLSQSIMRYTSVALSTELIQIQSQSNNSNVNPTLILLPTTTKFISHFNSLSIGITAVSSVNQNAFSSESTNTKTTFSNASAISSTCLSNKSQTETQSCSKTTVSAKQSKSVSDLNTKNKSMKSNSPMVSKSSCKTPNDVRVKTSDCSLLHASVASIVFPCNKNEVNDMKNVQKQKQSVQVQQSKIGKKDICIQKQVGLASNSKIADKIKTSVSKKDNKFNLNEQSKRQSKTKITVETNVENKTDIKKSKTSLTDKIQKMLKTSTKSTKLVGSKNQIHQRQSKDLIQLSCDNTSPNNNRAEEKHLLNKIEPMVQNSVNKTITLNVQPDEKLNKVSKFKKQQTSKYSASHSSENSQTKPIKVKGNDVRRNPSLNLKDTLHNNAAIEKSHSIVSNKMNKGDRNLLDSKFASCNEKNMQTCSTGNKIERSGKLCTNTISGHTIDINSRSTNTNKCKVSLPIFIHRTEPDNPSHQTLNSLCKSPTFENLSQDHLNWVVSSAPQSSLCSTTNRELLGSTSDAFCCDTLSVDGPNIDRVGIAGAKTSATVQGDNAVQPTNVRLAASECLTASLDFLPLCSISTHSRFESEDGKMGHDFANIAQNTQQFDQLYESRLTEMQLRLEHEQRKRQIVERSLHSALERLETSRLNCEKLSRQTVSLQQLCAQLQQKLATKSLLSDHFVSESDFDVCIGRLRGHNSTQSDTQGDNDICQTDCYKSTMQTSPANVVCKQTGKNGHRTTFDEGDCVDYGQLIRKIRDTLSHIIFEDMWTPTSDNNFTFSTASSSSNLSADSCKSSNCCHDLRVIADYLQNLKRNIYHMYSIYALDKTISKCCSHACLERNLRQRLAELELENTELIAALQTVPNISHNSPVL